MSDSVEDFISLPGDNAALDAMFVAPQRTFRGKRLFPYSEGVRILLSCASVGTPGADHWLMILMCLLMDLQEAFDKHKAAEKSDDDATDAATEELLTAIGDNPRGYQAKVIRRASKLGKKGVAEAVKMAMEIYEEAKSTELLPAETSIEPGK